MPKLIRRTSQLVLLMALAGCASGPDYQRPALSLLLPSQWFASDAAVAGAAPESVAALPDWRDYFTDTRLQALIDQALEHNRDLRIATARIAEARAIHGIERAGRWPQLEVLGRREAAHVPGDLGMTGQPQFSQRYDVGVELLNYELDFWGRVRRLDEAALAGYLASEEAQRAFRLALIADVANAYYSQCELRERAVLTRALAGNRSEVAQLSDQRRQAGLMGSMEYLRAAAAAEAARSDLAAIEQAGAAADHWLQLLVGKPIQETADAASPLPAIRPLAEQQLTPLAADLPADVLLRRPDVLAAEQRLIAANANIGAARAAFLPSLTLTGLLSTASSGLSNLFDAGSRAWIFKPQLRLPLFNSGRDAANVDLAEARTHVAVAEYEKTIQQAFREVADLLAARVRLDEQLQAQEANRRIQQERVELFEARYRAQISHYLEVLDARRDLQLADQAALQAKRAVLANAAQLYKALAGSGAAAGQTDRVAAVE
ncbi:Outer membrane protein OprM [Sterolibacterium denitrificans]|uniref:Outer membrane protein OprM n=1 Tax=Sterolibacterium denitrificans TaxID=157592 RepID=A0A7Z7HPS8_9PROT|nr:efflux transporter outer membrane subunit [Sterolibacterium denitrificans]SMB21790.1 Outer membrane protein OprM [Sterolibacterium denitrificans]